MLEGCYLRCGLASDILLMDGYPTKYNSFMTRLARWIRGDWQITRWIGNKKLNLLSKYKIFDNLRRSLLEISIIVAIIYTSIWGIVYNQKIYGIVTFLLLISILPYILEFLNRLIFKKEGEQKQKTFAPKITGFKGTFLRAVITLAVLPYKAYVSIKSITKTIYRMCISKKHLLEWTTSEEAEKQSKSSLVSYFNQMAFNVLAGVTSIGLGFLEQNGFACVLGFLWMVAPCIMWYVSRTIEKHSAIEKLNQKDRDYVLEIGKKTWDFFETYLTKENNYLIPDNYQEDRKEETVARTSSTNIGLSLLAVISAYDLKYITFEKAIELLKNILDSVESLQKWNGHLYNWYQIQTKEPLVPRYISTVDSGNFVGYLYVVKSFLDERISIAKNYNSESENEIENIDSEEKRKEEINKNKIVNEIEILNELLEKVTKLINDTDFSYLYSQEEQIFSIGFNIEDNKLTNSYYDLLASEARQASLVAIAKKDVPAKHWSYLSRTLTKLGKYKGLISWAGTAFEYLMPNINIPSYEGSLLDESCKFMIKSQMEYSKKLNIAWGISEAAFNLKDLKSNYQYKAFGIPWLGLKRGLADEMVVSSYGGILAINEVPKEEVENLKRLEQEGMYGKFGFYESIDYTPERVERGKISSVVKTYMAHHQGLILLSINNLFNNNILQKRFMKNPEIDAVSILLQETMPETFVTTKEKKEKVEKLKYKDYEDYIQTTYQKIEERLDIGNVISNEDYIVAMNQKGQGVSRYRGIDINRFKPTKDYAQGIFFAVKSVKSKTLISSNYGFNDGQYQISFMPDKDEQEIKSNNLKVKINTTVSSNEPVEIRRLIIENQGNEDDIVEVTSYFEPVLSKKEQDYAHPVFNNLFLTTKYDEKTNSLVTTRKVREKNQPKITVATTLSTNSETIGDFEYELEAEKFTGRGNLEVPNMIKNSIPFSKKIGLVTEPIIAEKRTIKVKAQEKVIVDFILSVGEDEKQVLNHLEKYKSAENVKKEFELSKARVEAESRYLRIKGSEIEIYQRMLSYIIFTNPLSSQRKEKTNPQIVFKQSDLWKYGISGDLPVILVKMKNVNDKYVIKEVLKAYEFFRTKNIEVEIVILDEEKHSYENYVREEIEGAILNSHMVYLKNQRGGIFTLTKGEIDKKDIQLLDFIADIVINSDKGGLKNNIKDIEERYLDSRKEIEEESKL